MKSLLLFFIFTLSLNSFAGKEGGGGNAITEEFASIALIQSALDDSEMYIRLWLQGLENQIKPGYSASLPNPRRLPIPAFAMKTVGDDDFFFYTYGFLSRLKIIYKTNAPCSFDEQDRDGSVVDPSTATICISGWSLSQKLYKSDYQRQVEALILHELSHLMGANEDEAISMQKQYLSDMQFVSKESVLSGMRAIKSAMFQLHDAKWRIEHSLDKPEDLSSLVDSLKDQIRHIQTFSPVTPVSFMPFMSQRYMDDLYLVADMTSEYTTGLTPQFPEFIERYNKGFQGKDSIRPRDWAQNEGEKITPEIHDGFQWDKIKSVSDVSKLGDLIESDLYFFDLAVIQKFDERPDISIDESKP